MASNKAELTVNIPRFNKALTNQVRENILAAVMVWHGGVVEILGGTRSGRVYRVPGTKRTYRASAPGEAPASRTGQLRQSYKYRVLKDVGEVGTALDRGLWLERGTYNMQPRPHLIPAYVNNATEIVEELSHGVEGWN